MHSIMKPCKCDVCSICFTVVEKLAVSPNYSSSKETLYSSGAILLLRCRSKYIL